MTLQDLARKGTWAEFPAGAALFVEGGSVGGVLVPEHGRIRVFRVAPTGREGTLYLLRRGDLCTISALGVLRGGRSSAHATADVDVGGWIIAADAFRAAFASDDEIRGLVLDSIAAHYHGLVELLDGVQFLPIENRLATYLLERAVVEAGGGGQGRLVATQDRIAADLWTAREVVSRGLKALERRGWLRVERGAVFVDDAAALERLLDA